MTEFQLKERIYAHDIINPPSESNSCNIDLVLNYPNCLLALVKGRVSYYTEYTLCVEKAKELGFTSSEQSVYIAEFRNLILAFNFISKRACFTREDFQIPEGGINIEVPKSRVTTQKERKQTRVNIEEFITLRDEVHVTVGLSEDIDCQKIIEVFQKLQSLKRFDNRTTSLELNNLYKAMKEYESAMSASNRISKYKLLFNALEFVINKDGKKREGCEFDLEVENLLSVDKNDVEEWRLFYNRTKHPDRNMEDVNKYSLGTRDIAMKYLLPVRTCCQNVLLNNLDFN